MDCFYASVELKDNPSLQGKPVAVGGPAQSRSVLCTANYEARKFGVRAALPSSQAVRLCPQLVLLPPRFARYREESHEILQIMSRYTDKIEPLSLDEAYLDVTDNCEYSGSATRLAAHLRETIFKERKLTASAGIAPNKFLAKVASDWKKPNGQFTIAPGQVEQFMPSLKIEKIFGIGPVTATKLHSLGIFNCADLQNRNLLELQKIFGKRGQDVYGLCRGVDDRVVQSSKGRKSVTLETTFVNDLQSLEQVQQEIPKLFRAWQQRMENGGYWDRVAGWVVKLKFFDFQSTTCESRAHSRPDVTDFQKLLQTAFLRQQKPVRLLGLGVRLEDSSRAALVGDQSLQMQLLQII